MSNIPFMQLYVSDYIRDTLHLTTEQHGAYMLLMMTMWTSGGRLKNDPKQLARIARVSPKRWHMVSEQVLEFFDAEDGFLTQKRLSIELQKVLSISGKRKHSGSIGGRAKALKNNDLDVANAKQVPKHSHITDNIKEKREAKASPKKGFRLPDDWRPDEADRAFAESAGFTFESLRIETDKFRDYWHSKAGQGAAKLDWNATWRNWIRQARKPLALVPQRGEKSAATLRHEEGMALFETIAKGGIHDPNSDTIDLGRADYKAH